METIQPIIQSTQPVRSNPKNPYKILFFLSLGLFLIISSVLVTLLIIQKSSKQVKTTNIQKTESITSIPVESMTIPTATVTTITETATVSNIPKDWKIYSSKELGLSFKYPAAWGEPKSEVVDYTNRGSPFYGKAVWINFTKPYLSGTKNIISIVGVTKDYQNYIDPDRYTGNQNNLDLPETFSQQKDNIYFTKKTTIANQKTAIETSLVYLIEASGVEIESSTKLNGKNEYTGITVTATYQNFKEALEKFYDSTENKGLEPLAVKFLTELKNGTSQDEEMAKLYKDYQTLLSSIKFN